MGTDFREIYDQIIDLTERYIKHKTSAIKKEVADKAGINERHMQTAFSIVSGLNYHEYVEMRKLWNILEYMKKNPSVTEKEALAEFNISRSMANEYAARYLHCESLFSAMYLVTDLSPVGIRYSYQLDEKYNFDSMSKKIEKASEIYSKDFDSMLLYKYLQNKEENLRGMANSFKSGEEIKCFKLEWMLEGFREQELCRSKFQATDDDIDNAAAIAYIMSEDILSIFEHRGTSSNEGWVFDEDYHDWDEEDEMNYFMDEDYLVGGEWDYERWSEDISMDMGYMEDEEEDPYY